MLLRLQSQTACVNGTYLWSPTALNDHPPTDKDNRHSPTRMPYHFRTERWNRRILVQLGIMCFGGGALLVGCVRRAVLG